MASERRRIFRLFHFGGKAANASNTKMPGYMFLSVTSVVEITSLALMEEGKINEIRCCHSSELVMVSP